jgi:SAM-dependent methyltransferase
MENEEILKGINQYYSEKIKTHGPTPSGVDWNSIESQYLRFGQLSKIFEDEYGSFSVLDYGCGFGSFLDYLRNQFKEFSYSGFDISAEMITEAIKRYPPGPKISWTIDPVIEKHDYLVGSGLFNVRNEINDDDWISYILSTLNEMNRLTIKGFSFNILTSYSDEDRRKDYLYYADPLFFFDYCKKNFSKQIALLHDYPIYEFTILVRK